MAEPLRTGRKIHAAMRVAAAQRQRATRASAIAERHEAQAQEGPESLRAFHRRLAEIHRAIEQRHLIAVQIHGVYVENLKRWRDHEGARPPEFITAVAEATCSDSTVITLLDSHRCEALVVASDDLAQTAHDLETTFAEGPMHDAVTERRLIAVQGRELQHRWPLYGSAMLDAGIRATAAAPLHLARSCLGALAVFHPHRLPARASVPLDRIADAVTHTVLSAQEVTASEDDSVPLPLLEESDHQATVNRAAGIVAVDCACKITDALALIQARSFAEGRSIISVATEIVSGRLRRRDPE
ncbi:hypothetical protein BC739_007627 [Kutzneria viridogrisea]|uniref:ANTAR domain-containing protein n=1 Tax=Kutzneria viridogrisea TaxID=47990 RepID=A0ABR6BTZ9_9PSEU|nr:hypothetical protein [Kutzneria viridogrisea]